MLRAEPELFRPVASDPTVSRLVDTLVAAGPRALTGVRRARAEVRERVWRLAVSSSKPTPQAAQCHSALQVTWAACGRSSPTSNSTSSPKLDPNWRLTFDQHAVCQTEGRK